MKKKKKIRCTDRSRTILSFQLALLVVLFFGEYATSILFLIKYLPTCNVIYASETLRGMEIEGKCMIPSEITLKNSIRCTLKARIFFLLVKKLQAIAFPLGFYFLHLISSTAPKIKSELN